MPPSNSPKSWISSIRRRFSHSLSRSLSSLKRLSSASSFHLVLLPLEELVLRRFDGAVLQALRNAAGEDDLDGGEEPGVELLLGVGEQLPDAVTDGHPTVLQLQHTDGDAVHVDHAVRPPLASAPISGLERHILGDGEVVVLRLAPVDEVDGLRDLARLDLHRHAVAQQVTDRLVVPVEAAAVVVRLGAQPVQGHGDLGPGVAALAQPGREQTLIDSAVTAAAVGPIAQLAVAQLVAEQGDDAVLGGALGLVDAHAFVSSARISVCTYRRNCAIPVKHR